MMELRHSEVKWTHPRSHSQLLSGKVEVESPGGRIPQLILTTTGQCILTKMFGCILPSDVGMQELDPDGCLCCTKKFRVQFLVRYITEGL